MEVHVLEATPQWYKVSFKDAASRMQVVLGLSGQLSSNWGLRADQLMPTVTSLADEIFMNHDPAKPFLNEYLFTPENSQKSLSETIDNIRRNSI